MKSSTVLKLAKKEFEKIPGFLFEGICTSLWRAEHMYRGDYESKSQLRMTRYRLQRDIAESLGPLNAYVTCWLKSEGHLPAGWSSPDTVNNWAPIIKEYRLRWFDHLITAYESKGD